MSEKKEQVVMPIKKQTKTGYIAIYRGAAYGERAISIDDPILYEDKTECFDETKDDKGFLTVATLTWEE
jgi:hypothetical protein